MKTPINDFDNKQLISSFAKAAKSYDAAAGLQRNIGDQIIERLDYIKLTPGTILDLGAGSCHFANKLAQHFPKSQIIAMDIAQAMIRYGQQNYQNPNLNWLTANANQIPLATNSIDFIFSNLMFQWCENIETTLKEIHRTLRPGGLLMFATFGPDSLQELRYSWAQADNTPHVNNFMDMHDLGDAILATGFADPVMDIDYHQLSYQTVKQLMQDLKDIGAHNVTKTRHKALTAKGKLNKMIESYEQFRQQDNTLPATYEVIYGHAWGRDIQKKTDNNTVEIPLSKLKR